MAVPLAVIGGHKKALSYVRFMGGDQLVSASTDNTLRLWDINAAAASEGRCDSLMTYSGEPLVTFAAAFPWQVPPVNDDRQESGNADGAEIRV